MPHVFLPRCLIFLLGMTLGGTSVTQAMTSDAYLCDQAAEIAAQSYNAPLEILQAITRVETGRSRDGETVPWPWTINFAGKGYWFETESEAFDFANTLLSKGKDNFDLGCFQVNQHWHGDKFASLAEALSPETNARIAAEFLDSLYDTSGDWGTAVAAYHSKTKTYGQKYLAKVEAVLQDRRGKSTPEDNLVQVQSRNGFLLLQHGLSNNGPSLVPIGLAGMPLFTVSP
jgi:hypothetical protein